IDLKARAHQAVLEAGFRPDFPPEVIREVQGLKPDGSQNLGSGIRDLRALQWSLIDNDQSRELDQIEYARRQQNGGIRLLVGIADVDGLVRRNSATDHQAATECTSVYTGVATYPMLPDELSTGLTSLLGAQDRLCLVVEMHIQESGEVAQKDVYPAWV